MRQSKEDIIVEGEISGEIRNGVIPYVTFFFPGWYPSSTDCRLFSPRSLRCHPPEQCCLPEQAPVPLHISESFSFRPHTRSHSLRGIFHGYLHHRTLALNVWTFSTNMAVKHTDGERYCHGDGTTIGTTELNVHGHRPSRASGYTNIYIGAAFAPYSTSSSQMSSPMAPSPINRISPLSRLLNHFSLFAALHLSMSVNRRIILIFEE
ncbi:uncharacterized protein EV420DRAFT_738480 [Desarmillaria tabescens]|uniref:Uncharacterized protein n=1 Tax=Armillaria tabescens TaxID=1929756 RepID=A0AA39MYA9_ARMTA|nr:uncharacterized protein EV420DRAFT_738480 [Desarmillaria tabescens]KAK0450529.1 hypothetical protein EV420DRAFT_738480 [Desarmillaria tabescens]